MLLAEEIGETNRIVNNISQSVLTSLNKLDAIEEYSELTAYYSRTTAMSTSYVAWLNFLKN